jgi:hypothetical protein
VLTLPTSVSAVATSDSGAVVTYQASALDAVSGPRPVSCTMPSGRLFPIGSTAVLCSAFDAAGNLASGQFVVTVTAPSKKQSQ